MFVGKFEDIIPFSKKECENYIEVVKEALNGEYPKYCPWCGNKLSI